MSNATRFRVIFHPLVCPACGGVHEWTKDKAWLSDGGEQYRGGRQSLLTVNDRRASLIFPGENYRPQEILYCTALKCSLQVTPVLRDLVMAPRIRALVYGDGEKLLL